MASKFVHMHVHDQFSLLDGVGTAEQYAKEAARLEMESIAITNHGNIDGCIKFQSECDKAGIKSVLGAELYVVEDMCEKPQKEKRFHICLLSKNEAGFKKIMKILTTSNIEGFHKRPRISMGRLLPMLNKDLVVTSACTASFLHMRNGEDYLKGITDIVGSDSIYLEVMPLNFQDQFVANRVVLRLASRHGLMLLASNDCHYPTANGAKSQEVLLAIQSRAKWKDKGRWKFDASDLYLKTKEEMETSFQKQGILSQRQYRSAIRASLRVASQCAESRISKRDVHLPMPPGLDPGADEGVVLLDIARKGLYNRVYSITSSKEKKAEYRNRLMEEFRLICQLGFERYFLIVWELIAWCKKNDIMTGPGRGSVGGSLLAYCLGITDVDPIKHDLIFSRFISPARIDLPDIDMDFEDRKRHMVRKHLEDIYGKDCVAGLSTFGTMKGRGALRDVARVFDVPAADVGPATKSIVVRSGGDFRANFTIEDAFDTFEEGKRFKVKYPNVTALAISLEGQVRSAGQHAAAICVSSSKLDDGDNCNLCIRNGSVVANWEKNDAEYMGMMKLDVLGLGALSVLSEAKTLIKERHGIDIEYDKIPLDDEETYKEIAAGHSIGCFQIGSFGIARYCSELKVENFMELVHANALWRPGTLRTGMTWEFTRRKHKQVEVPKQHPIIEKLTKDTYGIILYQEQIMSFMYDLAGLPWKTCDTVRKVISKRQGDDLFKSFREKFIQGCQERGTLDSKEAGHTWDLLSSFGSYGFNKAHSVEYSMIGYWDMWLKVKFPAEFMASVLTYGHDYGKEDILEECKRIGLEILPPKTRLSQPHKWSISGQDKLVMPLDAIKGVAESTAEAIVRMDAEKAQANTAGKRTAFFSESGTKARMPNKSILAKLADIKFYDKDYAFESADEKLRVSEMLSLNPFGRLIGVISDLAEVIATRHKFYELDDIIREDAAKGEFLSHVTLKNLRFGFRVAVLKAAKGGHVDHMLAMRKASGTSDNMGGVYGYIQDISRKCTTMGVFDQKFYSEFKNEVESIKDESEMIILSRKRGNSVMINSAITEEMASCCRIKQLGIHLGSINRCTDTDIADIIRDELECSECKLRKECKKPVHIDSPDPDNKFMIVGEAPGRDEDRLGKPFVGMAGNSILWPTLARFGVQRSHIGSVTNVVKCFPSSSKTPDPQTIRLCGGKWLDAEINSAKPLLILALGNISLYHFKGEQSGITGYNGKTEWSTRYKAWICYCVHPASVIYESSNKANFEIGIGNFLRCANEIQPGFTQREVAEFAPQGTQTDMEEGQEALFS